jgi:hypothetical protein
MNVNKLLWMQQGSENYHDEWILLMGILWHSEDTVFNLKPFFFCKKGGGEQTVTQFKHEVN